MNVEPRWSPDGKRIVYVSTAYNKRFHIFAADVRDGKLENVERLTERDEEFAAAVLLQRVYDTEISPVWSRDGEEILFVSNRGHILRYRRILADEGAAGRGSARDSLRGDDLEGAAGFFAGRIADRLQLVSWAAMASALALPANGGDAFPVSYGDWDETYARWSPDGTAVGLYFESQRKYGIVAADDSRRNAADAGNERAAIFGSRAGAIASASAERRTYDSGTSVGNGCSGTILTLRRMRGSAGRWLRSRESARLRRTTFIAEVEKRSEFLRKDRT